MLFNCFLVQGDQHIYSIGMCENLAAASPDQGEVVAAPDERGVIVIHVNAAAQTGQQAGRSQAGLIYAVSGYAPDESGKIVQSYLPHG